MPEPIPMRLPVLTVDVIQMTALNSAAQNRNAAKQKLAELEPLREQCIGLIENYESVMRVLGLDPEGAYEWKITSGEGEAITGSVYTVEPAVDPNEVEGEFTEGLKDY